LKILGRTLKTKGDKLEKEVTEKNATIAKLAEEINALKAAASKPVSGNVQGLDDKLAEAEALVEQSANRCQCYKTFFLHHI
jgi:hypothetical protein